MHKTLVDELTKDGVSVSGKYQDIYVGTRSISTLIKYELLTSFISPIPGAIGFFLRTLFYKKLFAKIGDGTVIGPYITLRCPSRISLGNKVFLDDNVTLDAKGEESRIIVGDSILIAKNSSLSCASSQIHLGDSVSVGTNCYIRASGGPVNLGSYITIGGHTVIISGNPDYKRLDIPMMKQQGSSNGITIGDDVWLGVGVRVIDGVTIGDGCVVGAGAVVTDSIPEYSIAAGVPARVIKNRKSL